MTYCWLAGLGIVLALVLVLWVVDIRPVLRLLDRLTRSSTTAHEGATESYGDELRVMREAQPSDELMTEPARMAVTHADLDKIIRDFREGMDRLCDDVAHRLDPFYERIMVDTGRIDMRELYEMLDREGGE